MPNRLQIVGAMLSALAVSAVQPQLLSAQVRTNFSILDSLTSAAVRQVGSISSCDSVAVVPMESALRWLVVEKLSGRGIAIRASAPCTLAIADGAVRYGLYAPSRDSIERTARVELRLLAFDSTHTIAVEFQDVLARADIALAELPRSELTAAPVPPLPRSLWDDLLEPVIVVASVATTLLLLFTVRSR
ncbi:MAG: hypothetical protein AA908_08965 [Chlorobi bacterium NICIL-2]|nr:MAG: hypothetical protein AA908_08965 [Chlorobi bacterium NICIL-2]